MIGRRALVDQYEETNLLFAFSQLFKHRTGGNQIGATGFGQYPTRHGDPLARISRALYKGAPIQLANRSPSAHRFRGRLPMRQHGSVAIVTSSRSIGLPRSSTRRFRSFSTL